MGVVYRHQVYVAEQLESFSKAMEELFSKLSSNNKEFYIMSDFNIDLLKAHSNSFIKTTLIILQATQLNAQSTNQHAVL